MISQSEIERERYESRLKTQRDAYSLQVEARNALERGLQQGRAEGRAQGREEGREEGRVEGQMARIQSFQRLMRQDITSVEQLRQLPFADLQRLAERLEAELGARLSNGA